VPTPNIYGPFFTQEELGLSDDTDQRYRASMYLLVKFGLNPIRAKYGPVKIDSGFRSLEHNVAVGGAEGSQHCLGEAADISCPALASNREVFEWLRTWWPGQLFYYLQKGHVHLALPRIDLQVAERLYAMVLDK
jgi:peptidase M15-like protein